jgi:ADP-heptose:LPS heptosyltransferase
MNYQRILVIQTAFIGDVILATSVVEKLHAAFPQAQLDLLVRKGNESLLEYHPFLGKVWVWDKKQNKVRNLIRLALQVRKSHYGLIVNLHRFSSSGIITALSGTKDTRGFDKNPLSFLFGKKVTHEIGNGRHEVERNQELIADITDKNPLKPKLYPTPAQFDKIKQYQQTPYICMAPSSVWFTKQLPKEKWVELIRKEGNSFTIFLLGAASDYDLCDAIATEANTSKIINLAGKLNLLESAALIKSAAMNYVNDSAPMHLASAMNAPFAAQFRHLVLVH